jgi:hypothetical protein
MKRKHYLALRRAVQMAAEWRGSLIGHYENDDQSWIDEQNRLAPFDAHIALCREALKLIRPARKVARKRKRNEKVATDDRAS